MPRDTRRLQHIIAHADELADMIDRFDVEEYLGDRRTRLAVERLLTIIGEAAKQLSPETRSAIDQPWPEIMRFRDKGIHGYDVLDDRLIFEIATENVPPLREAVAAHLAARTEG